MSVMGASFSRHAPDVLESVPACGLQLSEPGCRANAGGKYDDPRRHCGYKQECVFSECCCFKKFGLVGDAVSVFGLDGIQNHWAICSSSCFKVASDANLLLEMA